MKNIIFLLLMNFNAISVEKIESIKWMNVKHFLYFIKPYKFSEEEKKNNVLAIIIIINETILKCVNKSLEDLVRLINLFEKMLISRQHQYLSERLISLADIKYLTNEQKETDLNEFDKIFFEILEQNLIYKEKRSIFIDQMRLNIMSVIRCLKEEEEERKKVEAAAKKQFKNGLIPAAKSKQFKQNLIYAAGVVICAASYYFAAF